MAKVTSTDEAALQEGINEFNNMVEAETKAAEALLKAGKSIDDPPTEVPDPRIPKKKGLIKPAAFRKETTDMSLDALVRLNGKQVGEEVEVVSGSVRLKARISPEGVILIEWSGVTELS